MTLRIDFFWNITHRIEHLFRIQLTELNPFFGHDSQNWTFFFLNMTHRNWTHFFECDPTIFFYKHFDTEMIDPVWKMTQRIEPFLFFFSTMTQRIELFVNDSLNWASFMTLFSIRVELLFLSDSKNWIFEFFKKKKNDSKNWAFLKNTIQRTELFFNMTQRIFQYNSKNWTLLFNMTQRLFFPKLKEFDFLRLTDLNLLFKIFSKKKLKELIPFFHYDSQNGIFWSTNTTHSTEFFFQYDSQNWNSPIRLRGFNFFLWFDSKYWIFFVWLSELIFFLRNMTWLIELNLFLWTSFQDDSKSWSLSFWLKELNLSCFPMWLKELKSFFSKCLKEFNLSFMWTIFYMTQRT